MQLISWHKVKDFDTWYEVFRANSEAARTAGLVLRKLWVNADNPNEVAFLLDVADRAEAEAFMSAPEAAESAEKSGVMAGDYWFVEPRDAD